MTSVVRPPCRARLALVVLPPLRVTSARSLPPRRARSAAWCLRCKRKVCVAVACCAWLGRLLPPLRASARSDAWCLRSAASARSIWPFACAAREGPSVAKCPGWSLRDHCLGRYNLTGEAGRSSARHGRVRVGRDCVVWSLARYRLLSTDSNKRQPLSGCGYMNPLLKRHKLAVNPVSPIRFRVCARSSGAVDVSSFRRYHRFVGSVCAHATVVLWMYHRFVGIIVSSEGLAQILD